MKKTDIAEHFNVSRATVADWTRRGAPTDGDIGGMVAWKTRRDLERAGIRGDGVDRLPDLAGEVARRRESIDRRMAGTAKLKPELRVAVRYALALEAAILELPDRLLRVKPEDVPVAIHEIILRLLDEVKGGEA
jgi:hypothetical protein